MTLGAGAKSPQSGSHMTTIIQNFTLVNLSSTAMSHLIGLPFEATIPSYSTHSTTYTQLFIIYAIGRYFRLYELSVFCPLIEEWGLSFSERH